MLVILWTLNDTNLISAINVKVIPVDAYLMNVCKFSKGELNKLDQIVERNLRPKQMLAKQASDKRHYQKKEDGGRGKNQCNMYIRKQGCVWHATCQSRRTDRSILVYDARSNLGKRTQRIWADTVWYKERWEWGMVMDNDKVKLSRISNLTDKKPRQQEDPTWYSKRKTRSRFRFEIWNVPCNKILIGNRDINLCDIDNLLLRRVKEDHYTLLRLYP